MALQPPTTCDRCRRRSRPGGVESTRIESITRASIAGAMPASKGSMAATSGQRAALPEPIEELPDRRLHFSRSVTFVRCNFVV